ncbi:MAG: alkaline phosphatase family protein [Caulobacteraceae bacterium]
MALADIDTIIVVIMENRSFDHMLGYLSLPGGGQMPVIGLQADQAWLDAHANIHNGQIFRSHGLDPTVQAIADPPHNFDTISTQLTTPAWGGGPMGGFVTTYAEQTKPVATDLSLVMGYYDAEAVPTYDFFARNFLTCDHWFAALPAGTQPNRLMAMAGYSSIFANGGFRVPHEYLVYDWLDDHHIDWCSYAWGDFPFFCLDWDRLPSILSSLTLSPGSGRFRRYSHFQTSWASNEAMPSVIFIEPEYSEGLPGNPNDDHPSTGIAKGQAFLAQVYSDVISNEERWAKTMMVVTYDEHGGFFDHVPPLAIPATAGSHAFTTSGIRVPAFVISPQVSPGRVFNRNLDHTSILQLLADKITPANGYSVAVNARQGNVDRLANTLDPADPAPRTPIIPADLMAKIEADAAGAPASPLVGASPDDPANARAFHHTILKAQRDHPDLMNDPSWAGVQERMAGLS